MLIEGGPGTGKSVVAVNLLAELLAKRLNGKYVSKNAAPRKAFVETAQNAFDFLIVDEAHRLNEKSGLYGNQGDHQIKEIIAATPCAVFFIDEDQRLCSICLTAAPHRCYESALTSR